MAGNRVADQVQTRSTTTPAGPDAAAFDHAVRIIHQVCCFAGSFELVEDFRDQAYVLPLNGMTARHCSTG
jgi:hypothetical protein